MAVTVGIKALNEELHIEAAIASALRAVKPIGGNVVLADSGSTDRTIDIARSYNIRIVQLASPHLRSCGAGAQLAFQSAQHPFFYLLDGDMVLAADFLPAGLAYLAANPNVAAVGGHVVERNLDGEDFRIRAANTQQLHFGEVDRLDCGGLYRTDALHQLGYFTDQNLHSFEEFEVAARLRSHGWSLARIDRPAVDHFGHTTSGYRVLLKRVRSGYAGGPGEVLRGAIGQRHLPIVVRNLTHIRHSIVVIAWWTLILLAMIMSRGLALLALIVVPITFLAWRRRSLRLGLYSIVSWNVTAYGLITGFFRPRRPAASPIEFVELAAGPTLS